MASIEPSAVTAEAARQWAKNYSVLATVTGLFGPSECFSTEGVLQCISIFTVDLTSLAPDIR